MAGVSLKEEEKTLFSNQKMGRPDRKSRGRPEGRSSQQRRPKEKTNSSGGAQDSSDDDEDDDDRCYNCGKRGHYARDCWRKKKKGHGNVATSRSQDIVHESSSCEEEWDAEVALTAAIMEDEESLAVTTVEMVPEEVPYEEDWDEVATVGIQSVVGIEVADVDEPEEEFDMESWPINNGDDAMKDEEEINIAAWPINNIQDIVEIDEPEEDDVESQFFIKGVNGVEEASDHEEEDINFESSSFMDDTEDVKEVSQHENKIDFESLSFKEPIKRIGR